MPPNSEINDGTQGDCVSYVYLEHRPPLRFSTGFAVITVVRQERQRYKGRAEGVCVQYLYGLFRMY